MYIYGTDRPVYIGQHMEEKVMGSSLQFSNNGMLLSSAKKLKVDVSIFQLRNNIALAFTYFLEKFKWYREETIKMREFRDDTVIYLYLPYPHFKQFTYNEVNLECIWNLFQHKTTK